MPIHTERKILPYTAEQLFALVADVAHYPEFLPWCQGARITRREGEVFWADLLIGFKLFRERFTSKVVLGEGSITVEYIEGPMRHLHNRWVFTPVNDGAACEIDFYLDFEFESAILQKTIGLFFEEAVKRMIGAFEKRAAELYLP